MYKWFEANTSVYRLALKIAFFIWLLSSGNPDILDQVIAILGTFS